jgi:hypothetical protein
MIDITIFPDCKKMVELKLKLLAESETEGRTLLRYFRADKGKSSGKLSAFLLPQAEEPLLK